MNLYYTKIIAIIPGTDELAEWAGPTVPGISFQDAEDYCQVNGLGYCQVTHILTGEIQSDDRTYSANWENKIDHDKFKQN